MKEEKTFEGQDVSGPGQTEMSEAEIDRNLEGTFPASDPPSWTLGTDHQSDSSSEQSSDDVSPQPKLPG